jgi:serralysin
VNSVNNTVKNTMLPAYSLGLPMLYEHNSPHSGLWSFFSNGTAVQPTLIWQSDDWNWQRTKIVEADVRGIGKAELCVLYDYGNEDTGLWVFPVDNTQTQPILIWRSGSGNWDWQRSKFLAADVHGMGKLELCVLYDYGDQDTGLWVFTADDSAPQPVLLWRSGPASWDWQCSNVVAADIRGVGKTELCILYDYGDDDTGLWVFSSDGSSRQPSLIWRSGAGKWAWGCTKVTGAYIRGVGNPALCALYDFGHEDTGLWVFQSDGATTQPALIWRSGQGNWDWHRSIAVGANVRDMGKPELCILYDYGDASTGLWVFPYDGSATVRSLVWRSEHGDWNWQRMK